MKNLILISFGIILLTSSCKKEEIEPTNGPVTALGANYQGGIVVYIDNTGQHGLIVSEADIDTAPWTSGPTTFVGVANAEIGTGKPNTDSIVQEFGSGNYAAKICYDLVLNGYDDWFLPSKFELREVASQQSITGVYGSYWSSTESVSLSDYAECTQMGAGLPFSEYQIGKATSSIKVRAVREF